MPLTESQLTQARGDHSGCGPSPCRAFYTPSSASIQDDTLVLWPFELFIYLTDDREVVRKPIYLFWIYITPHIRAGKGLYQAIASVPAVGREEVILLML